MAFKSACTSWRSASTSRERAEEEARAAVPAACRGGVCVFAASVPVPALRVLLLAQARSRSQIRLRSAASLSIAAVYGGDATKTGVVSLAKRLERSSSVSFFSPALPS